VVSKTLTNIAMLNVIKMEKRLSRLMPHPLFLGTHFEIKPKKLTTVNNTRTLGRKGYSDKK